MAIKKWKTQSEKVIFEHPRLVLIEDIVELPSGEMAQYLRFKHTHDVATVIAINQEGKILVQREYSHPPAEVLYQFPGGSVPIDEEVETGANRELMEECGLRGKLQQIGDYYIENRRTDAKTYVFVATNLEEAHLPSDAEEFLEDEWLTEEEIDQLVQKREFKHAYALATWTLFKAWQARD